MDSCSLLPVTVYATRKEALHVVSLDLRPVGGRALPGFEPGAHIDLHLPNGLVRSYSLLNPPEEKNRYVVAVLNDRNSRGGSRYVHEHLTAGAALRISMPRNLFALDESAAKTVLVAGGIGITPLLSMHRRLLTQRKAVELLYCARSRPEAGFCDELEATGSVRFRFDEEAGAPPNLRDLLSGHSRDSHFYCCGPGPMITAFEAACKDLGFAHIHVERFSSDGLGEASQGEGYQVLLARSNKTIDVPAGVPLLDALENSGIVVDSACREGMCGACETRVLEGAPDHRDTILTEQERNSNATMLICVSGCIGRRLVLDL